MIASYWKPQTAHSYLLCIAALLALGGVSAVEFLQSGPPPASRNRRLLSSTLAARAFATVKAERLERDIAIDPAVDPAHSGLVGQLMTPVTSNNGFLPAKQASVNPNFAAVVLAMLEEAGVQSGDVVAVGLSGSFPAINIAVYAALETLGAEPIVISSISASQWGANHPDLLWIDMERVLFEQDVFSTRSRAASIGGIEDRGIGISEKGLTLLRQAVTRNNLPLIDPRDYLDSVNQRMLLYQQQAGGRPIKAYINVGGGTTSVGTKQGKVKFEPGLNRRAPFGPLPIDSVMARFVGDDVPVIHLVNIRQLAGQYGLPETVTAIPRVGEGGVYAPTVYNPWLALGALVAVFVALYLPGTLRRLQTSPAHVAGITHADGRRNGKPRPGDQPILPTDRPRHSDHGGDSGRIPNGEVVL